MLARAFMFTGYLAEAEEHASVCQGMAAALLHPSARARVRAEAMQAQLLEERGQLQEAEKRQVNCGLIFGEVSINVRADCSYEQLLDDQLAYFGEIPLLLMLTGDVIATHQHCESRANDDRFTRKPQQHANHALGTGIQYSFSRCAAVLLPVAATSVTLVDQAGIRCVLVARVLWFPAVFAHGACHHRHCPLRNWNPVLFLTVQQVLAVWNVPRPHWR
jgi:hypothetical protein